QIGNRGPETERRPRGAPWAHSQRAPYERLQVRLFPLDQRGGPRLPQSIEWQGYFDRRRRWRRPAEGFRLCHGRKHWNEPNRQARSADRWRAEGREEQRNNDLRQLRLFLMILSFRRIRCREREAMEAS